MEFRLDDLRGEEIRELLRLHLASALEHSPPGSVHALGDYREDPYSLFMSRALEPA